MHRTEVIQRTIDRLQARTYVEIGIKRGRTFLHVRAPRKLGVDPQPLLARGDVLRACLRDPRNLRNRIYRMPSDDFFADPPELLARHGLDVAFIDGLHTHEQSLRDTESCLAVLRPGGVLLLHDCNPQSADSARPAAAPPQDVEGWSGDVWKTVVHLRAHRPDLVTFVLDCDWGIGVVARGDGAPPLDLGGRRLAELGYQDLAADRERLLGLRPPSALEPFLAAQTTG